MRLFQGEGAGFVEDDGVDFVQRLHRAPIFDQDALAGGDVQIVEHGE